MPIPPSLWTSPHARELRADSCHGCHWRTMRRFCQFPLKKTPGWQILQPMTHVVDEALLGNSRAPAQEQQLRLPAAYCVRSTTCLGCSSTMEIRSRATARKLERVQRATPECSAAAGRTALSARLAREERNANVTDKAPSKRTGRVGCFPRHWNGKGESWGWLTA
jgi:hypothetical protein